MPCCREHERLGPGGINGTKMVGTVLPNLDTVYDSHLHKKASNIIKDPIHDPMQVAHGLGNTL